MFFISNESESPFYDFRRLMSLVFRMDASFVKVLGIL